MPWRTGVLALALLLALFLMTGCGDDSSSSGDNTIETSSLSKAQFIKRADEICSKGAQRASDQMFAYIEENGSSSKSEPELTAEAIQAAVLPELEDQLNEIESLGAPEGDERQVEALLAAMRRAIVAVENRRELSVQTNIAPDFREAGKLSRQYGIEGCAYG